MKENEIPSAEEFKIQFLKRKGRLSEYELMIDFTKIHLEAQAKAIMEKVETCLWQNKDDFEPVENRVKYLLENTDFKDSILNAYPEELIK